MTSQIKDNMYYQKQQQMLLVYNVYRIISILVLLGAFWLDDSKQSKPLLYFITLSIYLLFAMAMFLAWRYRSLSFQQQVLSAGTVDVVMVVFLINEINLLQSSLGILLFALIAVLSILVPGRMALFFAAIASFILLLISILEYFFDPQPDLSVFFSTGIYGAGFFATAVTAWYLAKLVRSSEELAEKRGMELASIHRINEYIVERLQYGVLLVDPQQQIKVMNTAANQFLNANYPTLPILLERISTTLYAKYMQFLSRKNGMKEAVAQTTLQEPLLQVHFYSSSEEENPSVLILLNDISEIAQQAQQLKLASLGRFSASIAHELRNPLGAISHAIQLLGENNQLNEEDNHLRQVILRNCGRMNQVIKNVLQLSRRERSQPEYIELKSFLTQFKSEFCSSNSCEIKLQLAKKAPKGIVFDKSQLEQVLVILCDNAVQHGKDKKKGKAYITISVKNGLQKLMMSICDTGEGIRAENRPQIFEPFYSTLATGSGMGLFLAKELCEINQAALELLESHNGCCFGIKLVQNNEMKL